MHIILRSFVRKLHCAQGATLILTALLLCGAGCWAGTATAEELRLGGTGAGLANIQSLAEAFAASRPGLGVKFVPSLGSSGGIKALLAGVLDVSVSARRLKDEESAKGAVAVEYARTPFVFATRSKVVSGFSLSKLVQMYAGDVDEWPDGSPVRLVLRPTTDSDTQLLRAMSEDMSRAVDRAYARPGFIEVQTDQDNADALESVSGSIGTATLGQIIAENRSLRVLAVDGVEPRAAAAAAGRYPFLKVLFLVVRSDASPLVAQFVAYAQSPEARAILTRHEYWVHDQHSAR